MNRPDLHNLDHISQQVEHLVRDAGRRIMEISEASVDIHFKSRFNMVTEADLASEQMIIKGLKTITPDIDVLAEESSESAGGSSEIVSDPPGTIWVLDPLDGTTNYAHGFPHFCISLALCRNSIPWFGVVFDPSKNEYFHAVRGHGTTLNGRPINVSDTSVLEQSLVATGFPYKVRELKQNNLAEFCAFRLHCQGVRRFGAAALDLAYVAAGRLDGFWERWLKPWDVAAGVLMVEEAGGRVTRIDGEPFSIFDTEMLASNGAVHLPMQKILDQALPPIPDIYQPGTE